MKRFDLALLVLSVLAGTALAQDKAEIGKIIDLEFRVIDLVVDGGVIAGQTQDLEVKETETEIRIELAADVLFEFDKAVILPKAEETLKQAAALIAEKASDTMVRIEGHTDAKGDDSYNLRLSERRANAVKDWFLSKGGLTQIGFQTQGLGEQQPIAPNTKTDGSDDPEGRQKNRRVAIIVKKT
jgi:outer membrane protein OmpA-like peptidoglycan-associated protein